MFTTTGSLFFQCAAVGALDGCEMYLAFQISSPGLWTGRGGHEWQLVIIGASAPQPQTTVPTQL